MRGDRPGCAWRPHGPRRRCWQWSLTALTLAALAAPSATAGGSALTAQRTRIGDHPAFVRAVVDFAGGPLEINEIQATDPQPFADGLARLSLSRRDVRSVARPAGGAGIEVRVARDADGLSILLRGRAHRFKYMAYSVLRRPQRLVIDLWKSRPPVPGADVRRAPDRCLTLTAFAVGPREARAAGTERQLFEHGLTVRLRRADGRVAAGRALIAAAGRWRTRVAYRSARPQPGTLEAVAFSAKDGTLDCIVQARVTLRP